MSIWSDIIDGLGLATGNPQPGEVAAGETVGNSAGLAEAVSAFFADVTSTAMWRSLGWLLLGVLMMIGGVAWWVKGSASGPMLTAAAALA